MKAFLFDLNGTMIDDMGYHIKAWHTLIHKYGGNLTLEQTKEQCYGKNAELLERVFPGRFSEEEKNKIGYAKEEQYQREFRPNLKLINGLDKFLAAAHKQGIKMAIGSAAITFNIDFVLDGLNIRHYFNSIVSADDVANSKPNPETYLKNAAELGVAPEDCIVFEDAPKGVEAAQNAGMQAVVITSMHTKDEFGAYNNIIGFIEDYTEPWLQETLLTEKV
ncbi:MAG: HAD family phosphatase [Niastella sp.]|nr:HAD family phosphatase [Niastella sp.]